MTGWKISISGTATVCLCLCPERAQTNQPRASPWDPDGTIRQDALKGHNKQRPHESTTMAQSLVKNLVHLIYSTKHRTPCLHSQIRPALYAYKAGILQNWDSPALLIGGVA